MMSGRDQAIFILAAVVSLSLHAAIGYAVMNLRIDSASRFPLFEQTREPDDRPMRVQRASEDLIVERDETPSDSADPSAGDPAGAESPEPSMSDRLLDSLDPENLMPPEPTPEPEAEAPTPNLAGPTRPAAPQLAGTQPIDATEQLLRHAEPSVDLPEYVGPTDEVESTPAQETDIDPAANIDPAALDDIDPLTDDPADPTALAAVGLSGGNGNTSDAPGFAPGGAPAMSPYNPSLGSGSGSGNGSGTGSGNAASSDTNSPEGNPDSTPPARPNLAAALDLPEPPASLMNLEPIGPTSQGDTEPKPVAHLDDDFAYALRLLPDFKKNKGLLGLFSGDNDRDEPGYFQVQITPKRSLRRLKPLKKDVVYVIDTSSSITNQWVKRVRNGVSMALDALNEGDRFNIVTFKDTVRVFSEDGLADAAPQQRSKAREFLDSAEASGYTDVNRALSELIVRHVPDDRVYQIVLITDGRPTRGAVDPRQIINIITQENALVAGIFCVGIGDRVDRELLEYLAYRNKGSVVYPDRRAQTAATIRQLAGRLRYPVVKNASFSAAGVNAGWIYPKIPRDIYQGQPVSLFGRYRPDQSRKLSMRLSGINDEKRMDLTFTLRFNEAKPGNEEVARDWALHRLHHLYSQMMRSGEDGGLKQQIERLQREYDLEPIE